MLVAAPTALRLIVLHEFGPEGLADFDTFRGALLLLAEQRFGTKRRSAGMKEQQEADAALSALRAREAMK